MTAKTPKPGDRITWTHSQTGAGWVPPYTRTGIIWSGAPIEPGVSNAWWVSPDQPEPGDGYHVIYVGRRTRAPYYGGPVKGEVYASRMVQDVTSILTVTARRAADAVRATKTTRAGYAPAA